MFVVGTVIKGQNHWILHQRRVEAGERVPLALRPWVRTTRNVASTAGGQRVLLTPFSWFKITACYVNGREIEGVAGAVFMGQNH